MRGLDPEAHLFLVMARGDLQPTAVVGPKTLKPKSLLPRSHVSGKKPRKEEPSFSPDRLPHSQESKMLQDSGFMPDDRSSGRGGLTWSL